MESEPARAHAPAPLAARRVPGGGADRLHGGHRARQCDQLQVGLVKKSIDFFLCLNV